MAIRDVCRIGDQSTGTCWAAGHGSRTFIGTWDTIVGVSIFTADGIQVIRVGDEGTTDCGHRIRATEGSSVCNDLTKNVHRVGDALIVVEGGEGVSTTGSPSTNFG